MSLHIRKYNSCLLLLLFLFPAVQKGWHEFEHRNDSHCETNSEVHLHPHEHICDLCDFSISIGMESGISGTDILLQIFDFSFHDIIVQHSLFTFWNVTPPRAPPFSFS